MIFDILNTTSTASGDVNNSKRKTNAIKLNICWWEEPQNVTKTRSGMSHEMETTVHRHENYFMTLSTLRLSTQLCVSQKSSSAFYFIWLLWTEYENMRPTKHCRLIFRNSLSAKYSVADLIQHINKGRRSVVANEQKKK